jgi:type IV secretory pathway VirB2 component (pilin)
MIWPLFADAAVRCVDGVNACRTGLPQITTSGSNVQKVFQILFGTIAGLTVIMIIIAGLRLIAAQGNPQEAAKARQTVIFAILGLLVAMSAELIVTFVLNGI